ncbi:hypothetical protein Tco_0366089 [Tanacetum coccineum]
MDGRGAGSCIVFGSAPLCLSFSVSPTVRSSDVDRDGAGKGGSWVLTPDLVVMAKGHLLLFLYVFCSLMMGFRRSDKTSEERDHRRCLPQTSIPARPGWSVFIHRPCAVLRSCIASKWKKRSWVVTCRPTDRLGTRHIHQFDSTLLLRSWKQIQALLMGSSSPCLNRRIRSLKDERWKKRSLDVSLVVPSAYVTCIDDSSCLFGWKNDWVLKTKGIRVRTFMQGSRDGGWRFDSGVIGGGCFIIKEVSFGYS